MRDPLSMKILNPVFSGGIFVPCRRAQGFSYGLQPALHVSGHFCRDRITVNHCSSLLFFRQQNTIFTCLLTFRGQLKTIDFLSVLNRFFYVSIDIEVINHYYSLRGLRFFPQNSFWPECSRLRAVPHSSKTVMNSCKNQDRLAEKRC